MASPKSGYDKNRPELGREMPTIVSQLKVLEEAILVKKGRRIKVMVNRSGEGKKSKTATNSPNNRFHHPQNNLEKNCKRVNKDPLAMAHLRTFMEKGKTCNSSLGLVTTAHGDYERGRQTLNIGSNTTEEK